MRKVLFAVVALAICSGLLAVRPAAAKPISGEISITSKSKEAVEAFKRGRDYVEDVRTVEALEQFNQAIKLDPDFALAHAYLGSSTPGKEGLVHIERAASLAKELPEAEKTSIDILLAQRRGEEEKARSLRQSLATMAPNDWRVYAGLGEQLSGERKWNQAIAELRKAAVLNPSAGSVHNTMGYVYINMGNNDQAVESFQKYAELKPTEPNPQDSLAEALMAAGRFEEAEAAFRKAAEISPQFWIAWDGVAQTKFLRNDWAGGREALAKAKAAATRPFDKLEADLSLAWSYAAAGDYKQAMATVDAVEKAAAAEKVDVLEAFVRIDRAILLKETGKYEDALKEQHEALEMAQRAKLPGGSMNALRRTALIVRIDAESKLGRAADAKKTLALLEEEAKKAPANAELKSSLHFGQGAEAIARGDAKAAAQHFSQCDDDDFYCRLQLAKAQEKAGDKTGAEATRTQLLAANRRGPLYLWVRSEVTEKAEATAR